MLVDIEFEVLQRPYIEIKKLIIPINIPDGISDIYEYLDNLDKIGLMSENDIDLVIDYKIHETKNSPSLMEVIGGMELDKEIVLSMAFAFDRLKNEIVDLPVFEQATILLKTVTLGLEAKIATLEELREHKEKLWELT